MICAPWCLAIALLGSSVVYPPDASLRAEEYVRDGMPAPDRAWSPADYAAAATVLERLSAQDPAPLPRYGSKTSGAVFTRMAAAENLAVLGSGAAPVATRLSLALDLMPAVKRILLAYVAPASRNIVFDRELAECMGFLLLVSSRTAEIIEEFMATLPPDDPRRQVRLDGLTRVRSGLSEILSGALESLAEKDTYRPDARRSLARHVELLAPQILMHVSELQRAEAHHRLEALGAAEVDPIVRGALASAILKDSRAK